MPPRPDVEDALRLHKTACEGISKSQPFQAVQTLGKMWESVNDLFALKDLICGAFLAAKRLS